jgi:hypothetical protein
MPGDPLKPEFCNGAVTAGVSHEDDFKDLMRYYEAHPHPNYALRRQATAEMCGRGGFVILRCHDEIVGAGGIFPIGGRWVELGQARITLNGRGLYGVLVNMRLLRSRELFPDATTVFAEVDAPNRRVTELLKDHFFVEFEPGPVLYSMTVDGLPPGKRPEDLGYGFNWLRASPQSFAASKAWYFQARRGGGAGPDGARVETVLIAASDRIGRASGTDATMAPD